MHNPVSTSIIRGTASTEHPDGSNARPGLQRENTSDILEYYNSPDASVGYSATDLTQARTSHSDRPSTAPTSAPKSPTTQTARPSSQRSPETPPKKSLESPQNSIKIVTHTNRGPVEGKRRPSIPQLDPHTDNRRIAIVERDQSPIPNSPARSPNSPLATGNASPSILTRRGVDRSRLALVSPPDVAPSTQIISNTSSPASASFLLSKSSRSKFADKPQPALPSDVQPAESSNNNNGNGSRTEHGAVKNGHSRQSSEITAGNASSPGARKGAAYHHHTGSNSGSISPKSPRDIGIVGTMQSMSRNMDLNKGRDKEQALGSGSSKHHNRHRSADRASSESDYGDEPMFARAGEYPIGVHPHSPVFQTPRPDESVEPNPITTGSGTKSATSNVMHMTLPPIPRRFGSTPLLTPAIGDSKPIDVKVAAPVVVDIHSDLADLWLAATPDADIEQGGGGSSLASPITVVTTTTESSSVPTTLSMPSSRKSSVTSPQIRTHYESVHDAGTRAMPIPPRHIDVGSLSPSVSPVCPPRPQRQPSPAKGHPPSSLPSREDITAKSTSTIALDERLNIPEPPSKDSDSKNPSDYPLDPKYMLFALSDSESGSEYSHDIQAKKKSRSLSNSRHSTLSKNGSIHIREGAFPAHSVFLNRIKTEVDVEPPEAEMKTPTKRTNVTALFSMTDSGHSNDGGILVDHPNASMRSLESATVSSHNSTSQRPRKASQRRSSNELPGSIPKSTVSDSIDSATDENKRSRSLRSSRNRSISKGKKDDSLSPLSHSGCLTDAKDSNAAQDFLPDSPTDSTLAHRLYPHSHLGHGPPPSERNLHTQPPSSFKAKGPLVTSGSLKTEKSKRTGKKPKSSWPPAMSFTDVLAEPTPLARALGYAAKLAELTTEDCGLGDWIDQVLSKTRPTVMSDDGPIPVGPIHTRFVSGSSARSEATFPMRADAYKVMDLTRGAGDISTTEVPSKLPYPSLALRQETTGQRQPVTQLPPPKSLSAAVKSGSAGFFSSLGRKASMRNRGTQSATESREREKDNRPPRRLVSKRAPPERSGGTPPELLTPTTTVSALPSLPTMGPPSLPGGPRAPRAKRASTMMISAPIPIISAPIPQPPLSAGPNGSAQPHLTGSSSHSSESTNMLHPPLPSMNLREVPRAPEGPRPVSKLTRTPSFPGSARISQAGNLRSTASFRPPASMVTNNATGGGGGGGPGPSLGHGPGPGSIVNINSVTNSNNKLPGQGRDSNEFTRQLDKLCDILPNANRETLAIYLDRASGQNMIAIGRYLEDERNGKVPKS